MRIVRRNRIVGGNENEMQKLEIYVAKFSLNACNILVSNTNKQKCVIRTKRKAKLIRKIYIKNEKQ